jgi:hypothetical protein
LTTAACGGLRSAPDCRPRSVLLHLSYSCASPCGPALLVTQAHSGRGPKKYDAVQQGVEPRNGIYGTSDHFPAHSGLMLAARILDPKRSQITEYLLPRSTNIRRVYVDSSTTPSTFWAGSNHGASIVKMEPLD